MKRQDGCRPNSRKGDEIDHVALSHLAHIFGYFDQAVGVSQGRDQARSVACEFGDREAPIPLRELCSPKFAPPRLLGLGEDCRQGITRGLQATRPRQDS